MISYHLLLFLLLSLTSIAPSYGTDCPTLSSPQNGRVSIIGTYALYSCNTGYTLTGISFRSCSNGRWSGSAPTCCPTLSSPQNGSVSVAATFASYSCNNGYTLSGFSFRTCSNGRWSGTAPTCVVSCPTLDRPQNGRVSVTTYGSIFASYSCNTGYELRGSSIRFCVGGRWTGSVPTCEYQDGLSPEGTTQGSSLCSTLSSPQNGTVSITGTIATYFCNRGYTLRGSSSRFCNGGRWSSSTPTCVALSASSNSCSIKTNGLEAAGTPYYRGSTPRSYKTYSCLDYNNCSYSVHVLGVYEASSNHGFRYHPTYNSYVYISTTGSGDTRPLVLVLSSHEPVNWNLRMPTNLVFDKVIVSSYRESKVTYASGQVLEVEKDLNFYGYGSDSGGGQTQELLQAISQRLSPVTSFTGTYQADRWDLNIDRNVPTSNEEDEEEEVDPEDEEQDVITVVYFWEGRHAKSMGWLHFTHGIQKQLEHAMEGPIDVIRFKQQQENVKFLSHFGRKFIIHRGHHLSETRDSSPSLYQIRASSSKICHRVVQVPAEPRSLNSCFCHILKVPFEGSEGSGIVYIWIGGETTQEEAIHAEQMGRSMFESSYSNVVIREGSEQENFFWVALGGKGPYETNADFMKLSRLF